MIGPKFESEKSDLLKRLALSKITRKQFVDSLPDENRNDPQFAEKMLVNARKNRDILDVEFGLALARSPGANFPVNIETLCDLLFDDWHYSHEDIAFFLAELHPPEAVDCLERAATIQYPYLNYDETFQFARKCIKALSAISNENAIRALGGLAQNQNEVIRGYAIKELRRKDANSPSDL